VRTVVCQKTMLTPRQESKGFLSSPQHPDPLWAHPMVTADFVPGVKRPGREVDHSRATSAKVKNSGAIPPLAQMSSWYGA
jgi:hypothetical protein